MNDHKDTGKNKLQVPSDPLCILNSGPLKGLLALLFGSVLVIYSYQIILNVLLCLIGLLLIDYGLRVLQVKPVTDYVDGILVKLRALHNNLM